VSNRPPRAESSGSSRTQRSAWIDIVLIVASGALLWLGTKLSLALATALGIFCLAAVMGKSGIEMLLRRRAEFNTQRWGPGPKEVFTGAAAQLYGVWFLAAATLLLVLGISALIYSGGMQTFWTIVLATPRGWGALLIVIGGLIAIRGVARMLAGTASVDYGLPASVGAALARTGGAVVTTVGSVLVALGLWLVLAPAVVTRVATNVVERIFK
jgi:hypothetical protein